MAIGLIIIGDEILSGKRVDKHFSKVVELLSARGMQLAASASPAALPARGRLRTSREAFFSSCPELDSSR